MKTKFLSILLSLMLVVGLLPVMSLTTLAEGAHTHDGINFNKKWDKNNELPDTSGNYYLTKDVTISETWDLRNNVNISLCLNGHKIELKNSSQNDQHYVIQVGNSTLNLYDRNSGDTGTITGGAYGVYIGGDEGRFNMYGGKISGCDIGVGNHGKFNMYGGKISGNKPSGKMTGTGGVWNNGTFNMSGGEISGNTAVSQNGSGVNNWGPRSTFNMSGGKISGNMSEYGGGGIMNYSNAIFNMSGGKISGNTATSAGLGGGGILNLNSGTFNMSGGKISGNMSEGLYGGGGVLNMDSTFNMSGGEISGNTGGGVIGSFNVSGNPKITGNTINGKNNNVFLSSDTNITITSALTSDASVGVTMSSPGTFTSGYKMKNGSTAPSTYFSSDDNNYVVTLADNGEAQLAKVAKIVIAPTAKNLTYNGSAQTLVNPGSATDGTMQYALGNDAKTAPTTGWSTSIPTGTNAGTYYVWYKAVGVSSNTDSEAACITVTIAEGINNNITISTSPASVKAKVKKNKVTVTWKKIKKTKKTKALLAKIKSIQVQYADNKRFTKNLHSKKVGKSKTKVTFKLKNKKTYYVRVRYVGNNGYSKWSKVKKVRTK